MSCLAGDSPSCGSPQRRLSSSVAGPELVRPVRLLACWLVALAALGAVALDAALPSDALAALALGLGAGALVRLAFGTAAGVPPVEQVRAGARLARRRGGRPERLRRGSGSARADYVGARRAGAAR